MLLSALLISSSVCALTEREKEKLIEIQKPVIMYAKKVTELQIQPKPDKEKLKIATNEFRKAQEEAAPKVSAVYNECKNRVQPLRNPNY